MITKDDVGKLVISRQYGKGYIEAICPDTCVCDRPVIVRFNNGMTVSYTREGHYKPGVEYGQFDVRNIKLM